MEIPTFHDNPAICGYKCAKTFSFYIVYDKFTTLSGGGEGYETLPLEGLKGLCTYSCTFLTD